MSFKLRPRSAGRSWLEPEEGYPRQWTNPEEGVWGVRGCGEDHRLGCSEGAWHRCQGTSDKSPVPPPICHVLSGVGSPLGLLVVLGGARLSLPRTEGLESPPLQVPWAPRAGLR